MVNATGVWSDDVRALDEGTHPSSIRPAKGVHITVPWSLVQNEIAVVIPVPKDRRSVFVVPWGGEGGDHEFTYIGTTDTDYDGPIDDPQITPDDVEYLLRCDQRARSTTHDHRVRHPRHVGRAAAARARRRRASAPPTSRAATRVRTSDSGVITVTGGKLTTYRRMAADAVDAVDAAARRRGAPQPHEAHPLHGAAGCHGRRSRPTTRPRTSPRRYGTEAERACRASIAP